MSSAIQTIDNVVVAPNPFKPYSQAKDYVIFYNLPVEFEIWVYSTGGGEVTHIKDYSSGGRYQWNVKDASGNALTSGVYICYIKGSDNQSKYIKLVVIR